MKCEGCGVELQFSDSASQGYISEKVMADRLEAGKKVLCYNCFSMKHYSQLPSGDPVVHSLENLQKYLELSRNVLYIIDLSDFNGTFREDIMALLKNHRVIFILNKLDLLPREVTVKEVRKWASDILETNPDKIRPFSALTNYGVNSLQRQLKTSSKDFVAIGVTNVGKSSVINGLLRSDVVTVSRFPGTTLEAIPRSLEKDDSGTVTIFDTPGLFTDDRLTDILNVDDQGLLLAKKKLERTTVEIRDQRTLFLTGFVRIDILSGAKPVGILHCFAPESAVVHETNIAAGRDEWDKWFGILLKPPYRRQDRSEFDWKTAKFRLNRGKELHINGLGWINVEEGPLELLITLPRSVRLKVRKGLVGPEKF